MTADLREKQTTINVQEKANLIWAIADKLVGVYKPHEYGKVILPMCVIKRFSDALQETKQAVLDKNAELNAKGIQVKDGFLKRASGRLFYNTSRFTLEKLKSDPNNIADNFRSYLQGFSDNVIDIIQKFDFDVQVKKMEENDILYSVITEFCTAKANLHPDIVTSADMGYIFEELVRKFSESYDEQAGAHFTARDIIYLMTDILVGEDADKLRNDGISTTIYDMAMGTSQMLGCMTERLLAIDPDASIKCFGQELNEETYAIAKADMLIKGGDADNMKHGNTLSHDAFEGYQFDYIISNPPFGIEWKKEQPFVEAEYKKGDAGRFGVGLPSVSDGQQLFMLNGLAKLKDTGRMAIIQNGSPLFSGDAGSGQSNIRGYLLENDWLEAIIQLPNDMFYNTGIATYIWVVSKRKSEKRIGKVQLIDASKCFEKRRKSLGNKKNEFSSECIKLIVDAYLSIDNGLFKRNGKVVESKLFDRYAFKYSKVMVEYPICNESGAPILKNGKLQPDSKLRDTEIIQWGTDFAEYMKNNVWPYAPNAWIDKKKTKTGYEILLSKYFYKPEVYNKPHDILNAIRKLELESIDLSAKISQLFLKHYKNNTSANDYVDTGIEWFPKMPSNWKRVKGKNVLTLLKRPVMNSDGVITCFRDGEVTLRSNRREEGFTFADKEIGYQGIESGDLVVHGMDGFAGAIGISDSRGKGSPVLNVCLVKEGYNKLYIMWYLRLLAYQNVFLATSTGIRERSCDLRWNKLANLDFIVPDINEQDRIVEIIESLFNPINNLISNLSKIDANYKLFKKAIISELIGV